MGVTNTVPARQHRHQSAYVQFADGVNLNTLAIVPLSAAGTALDDGWTIDTTDNTVRWGGGEVAHIRFSAVLRLENSGGTTLRPRVKLQWSGNQGANWSTMQHTSTVTLVGGEVGHLPIDVFLPNPPLNGWYRLLSDQAGAFGTVLLGNGDVWHIEAVQL